jgi:predicted amidohydrolase
VSRQSKRRRFELTPEQVEKYGLSKQLSVDRKLEEAIGIGTVSRVLETSAGRYAVVVCEDLAHVGTVGSDVLKSGTSLMLCPELSSELREKDWEHRHAGALQSSRHPIKVVIANSLAIPRAQGMDGQVHIAAGVVRSRFFAGTVGAASEVTAFRITRNELLERIVR